MSDLDGPESQSAGRRLTFSIDPGAPSHRAGPIVVVECHYQGAA
jgi:hypothetical protein